MSPEPDDNKQPISAAKVKELRDLTGAPMMDCKKALTEANGETEKAIIILRKRGAAVAQKKATRVTSEGSVTSYIHAGGKIGVLVEINCESDFVARTDDFKELAHDIAMHIAASDPKYVRKEDVTPADFAREKEIYLSQAMASGKPANIAEKMVTGKMEKFYEEVCLYEQPFIKDQTVSISQLITTKTKARVIRRAPKGAPFYFLASTNHLSDTGRARLQPCRLKLRTHQGFSPEVLNPSAVYLDQCENQFSGASY